MTVSLPKHHIRYLSTTYDIYVHLHLTFPEFPRYSMSIYHHVLFFPDFPSDFVEIPQLYFPTSRAHRDSPSRPSAQSDGADFAGLGKNRIFQPWDHKASYIKKLHFRNTSADGSIITYIYICAKYDIIWIYIYISYVIH